MQLRLTTTQSYISLSWPNKLPRGPGLWKLNNTLLNDTQYVSTVRNTYAQACSYYSHVTDERLFWELMKMEIRSVTISLSKSKTKCISNRAQELRVNVNKNDRLSKKSRTRSKSIWFIFCLWIALSSKQTEMGLDF